nr:hypothetical protein CFP56_08842 [Quercus suber]
MCRAIRNSIPSKANLKQRKILTQDTCEQCQAETENVVHALWSCPSLTSLWSQNSAWSFRASTLFISFKEIVEKVIEVEVDLALFATMV